MRILVTGASGFIGKALCGKLLQRGHEVVGLCRTNREFHGSEPDLFRYIQYRMGEALPEEVTAFSPEVLVHLAWDGIPDFSERKCVVNVDTQVRFLDQTASLGHLRKIIGAGTCREYGAGQGACVESDRVRPDSYFSWAKQTLAEYFRLVCQQRQMNFVWFRIFYIYGPGQRAESLIPTLIRSIQLKQKPDLKNPSATNDFVYIDDVVCAFIKAIEDENCQGTLNLGSAKTISVAEIAEIVEQVIGVNGRFSDQVNKDMKADELGTGMWADITLANRELDWRPQIALVDGIRRTCGMEH